MNTSIIGSLIKMNRLQQNMSQKALSEGICVPSYLSKIENAEIVPTSEIINLLFDALGITYSDSEAFISESKALFEKYLERLTFNDFEESGRLFERIESMHNQYVHSPLIIDYYIVRLARYCSTSDRALFEEPDRLLTQVVDQMDGRTQVLYYLYKAIDLLQLTNAYAEALTYLDKGLKWGENGHIYYWLSTTYMYQHKTLKAIEYAQKAMNVYLSEGNVTSMMCTYELIARIHMMIGDYEEAKHYLETAMNVCQKLNESYFKGYLYNKMAWCALCMGQLTEAKAYIQKDCYSKTLMMKIDPCDVRLVIAYQQHNQEELRAVIQEIRENKEDVIPALWRLILRSLEDENYLAHPDTEKDLIELIHTVEKKIEVQYYFQEVLIDYYKLQRKYKEALNVRKKNNEKFPVIKLT